MPKDFSEYLTTSTTQEKKIDIDLGELEQVFEEKNYQLQWWQILLGNTLTTTALSILTQPLQVIYTSHQLSIKKVDVQINNIKEIMEAKITVAQQKKLEQVLKVKALSYKAASYQNYNGVMKSIAEQGILGFFKGLGTGIIYQITNSQLRYLIIQKYFNDRKLIQNIYASSVALAVDIITNPLQLIQSRMILQNRLPNFRTYPSIVDLLKTERNYFTGSSGHCYKHFALFLFQIPSLFMVDQRMSLGYLLLIQSIVVYPFLTVIRRLQCQSRKPFMLNTEYKGFLDATRQIYQQEGIPKFYGGFVTFMIANTFISFVLYSTQLLGEAQD